MNNIVLIKNQSVITTSLLVADKFERHHRDVLRAIKKLDCSQEFNERNFTLVEYVDAKGEKRPMYQMTKDGLVFSLLDWLTQRTFQTAQVHRPILYIVAYAHCLHSHAFH